MKVRVLQTNNTLKVTCRDIGDRPSYEGLKVDRSVTDKLAIDEKVDAEVIGFDFQKAYLRVVNPSDPSKATIADLARKDFAEGAEKELRIGSKIQVRRKYAARTRRAVVSMRDPSRRPEDISVGDTLPGTVDSILRGTRPGIFLDVGVDRPAYMDWQECGDGHDRKSIQQAESRLENFRSCAQGGRRADLCYQAIWRLVSSNLGRWKKTEKHP